MNCGNNVKAEGTSRKHYLREICEGAIGVDHSGNNLHRIYKNLEMKYLRKKKYYLIRWFGYDNEPTRESATNVRNDAALKKNITDFMATYQPPRKGKAGRQIT